MRKMKIFYITVAIILELRLTVSDEFAPIDHVTFLDDGVDPVTTSPQGLGAFPHDCVGNIHDCPDGFTVTLNLRPDPSDPSKPHLYVLSSGGQSPLSEGFYFRRNNGREYEIGVAKGHNLWKEEFFLLDDKDTSVAFTWGSDELTVYIDGIEVARQSGKGPRMYTDPEVDLFPEIVVGGSNTQVGDMGTATDVKVANVQIVSGVNASVIQSAVPGSFLTIGCVAEIPSTSADLVEDVSAATDPTFTCRSACTMQSKGLAFMAGTSCYCGDVDMLEGLSSVECADGNIPRVFWASHAMDGPPADWLTEISIEVINPSSKPYVRPYETVTFVISTTGPEAVVLHIDFNDGHSKAVPGGETRVGHMWADEGSYHVNITAMSRTLVETSFVDIEIEYVEEGRSPEQVHVKPDTKYDTEELGIVVVYFDAFSPKVKDCSLELSRNEQLSFDQITDQIFSNETTNQYPEIGVVNVSFTCTNDFGSTGDWHMAVSANPELQYENYPKSSVIDIPVMGATVPANNIRVYIDDRDETSQVTMGEHSIEIQENVIQYSGEHMIMLKSSGKTLLKKIFNLQNIIDDVEIQAYVIHTEVNDELEFSFHVGRGDFLHIRLEFGDGTEEALFIPSSDGPVLLQRNHSYANLGKHYVKISVANSVSSQAYTQLVSIERPIVAASMKGINQTQLGMATIFSLCVDMHITPSMPVSVHFDYNNGFRETVMLGSQQGRTSVLTHQYIFPDYGIYRVHAAVSNNISSQDIYTLVQVGENITTLDAYVDKDKGIVNEVFTFTIRCPRGSPIYVDIDMGDGEIVQTTRGVVDSSNGQPDILETTTAGSIQDRVLLRKKRAIDSPDYQTTAIPYEITQNPENVEVIINATEPTPQAMATASEVDEDWPPPTPAPNENFILTYSYRATGAYSVKVTVRNKFSMTETYLCPEIVVAGPNAARPTCNEFNVELDDSSTETEPLIFWRSNEINITTTNDISCGNSWENTYQPRYTWKSEWINMYGEWRPELEVCQAEMSNSFLVIPGNTLWYGDYKMTVTMALRTHEVTVRRKRSTGNETLDALLDDTTRESMFDFETTQITDVEITAAPIPVGSIIHIIHGPSPDILELHRLREQQRQNIVNQLSMSRATMLRSLPRSTYIRIVPSPLVADIADWEKDEVTNFVKADVIKANLTAANDPDVEMSNKTGMLMHLFCYVRKSEDQHKDTNLDELIYQSAMLSTNLDRNVFVYDTDGCYTSLNGTAVFGHEVNIAGAALNMNDDVVFDLIITKDTRSHRVTRTAHVYSTTISADALDNIDFDNLDVNAALTIISLVIGDGGSAASETMTKVVNVMDKVAAKIENLDQVDKTASVMGTVTGSGSLTKDAKATAASALGNTAGKAKDMGEKASLDQMSNIGGTMVSGVGNILPFPEPEEEEADEFAVAPASTTTMLPSSRPPSSASSTTTTTPRPNSGSGAIRFGGLDWGSVTTEAPYEGCINYTKAEKKEIKSKIILMRPKPPTGQCSIPTVAGLKREEVCDPDFEEDCESGTLWSFCCSEGCEVCQVEPMCCEMQEGLCAWVGWIEDPVAGDCDYWANIECNAMHPDDMEWMREKYDEERLRQKQAVFATRKKTTENGMQACSDISQVIMGKQGADDNLNIASPKMNMTIGKANGAVAGTAGTDASAMNLECENPFTYSDSADQVRTKVQTLELVGSDGRPIKVENSSEPTYIWLDGQPEKIPTSNHTLLTTETVDWEYHSTKLSFNDSAFQVIIEPFSPEDSYFIAIKYDDYPNDTYYDWMGSIPVSEEKWNDESYWPEQIQGFPDLAHIFRLTAFPDPSLTNNSGKYYIGVKLKSRMVDYSNPTNESLYSFRVFQTGCRFFNTSTDQWESGGMSVGNYTNIYKTQCLTNHLTSFGGDFVVPPNTIDFKTVFSLEKFLESMPVFITVTLVMVLYITIVIWARHADKKDLIKWGASPLEDNLPTDQYHYQMTVYTGVKKNANTTSRVSFILSGDESDTGVRRLSDGKRKELPVGSIYNYVLSSERCLGPLTYLRIWHDNTGSGKKRSWFLDQVQLVDLQTGDKYFFICGRWLAVEEDDGAVERIIPVAGMNDLSAFKHLFTSSVRKKLTNDHLWFSVVSRPTRSSFTRVQRVSCCVALLFLTMITNCMFFKSDENVEKTSAVTIGPFSFTLHQLFISVVTTCIVFPPNLFIVLVFKRARQKKNTIMQLNQQIPKKSKKFRWRSFNPGSSLWHNVEKSKMQKFKDSMRNIMNFHQKSKYAPEEDIADGRRRKKKTWSLPYWTIYIAWTICILSIVASGFFTILYSMEWGREKSLDWLVTFLLSFFQSVAVVQPIKVLLLAAFISCIMRKPELDEEEEDLDQIDTEFDHDNLSGSQRDLQDIMKERKMTANDLPPPDTETLEQARELRKKEMQMEAVLKECIVYLFFLMIIFFLSYQARDTDSFYFAENIKNTLFNSKFDSISKPQDFWTFIYLFLPSLYSSSWYNGRPLNWREGLQIDDRNTIRVGVARIRQQRVKDDTCKVLKPFKTMIHHCRDAYSWTDDDTKNYLPGWVVPPEGNETMVFENEKSSWVYRDSIELRTPPYYGTLTTYKGGGYTLEFARSRSMTELLLKELEANEWVSVNTRVVFVELTLYNANVNLFGSVIMMAEYMSTGAAITKTEVKVFRVSGYVGGFGLIVIFFEVAFLCFTLYFFIKMITDLRKQKLQYFMDFWNILEFCQLCLSLGSIAMYAMKKVFSTVAMNTLHESCSGDYVNFVSISIWDEIFTMILACVVFLATIKFVKMLKFNKRMGMLGDTIKLATRDLKYFSITFFIYFSAFCMLAYILFGKNLASYGSFIGSVEALFAFALGSFDFYEFQQVDAIMGPIFFFLYVAIVNIGLTGMFLTIIYDAFAQVKSNAQYRANDYEIVDFMIGKFKGVFGWG